MVSKAGAILALIQGLIHSCYAFFALLGVILGLLIGIPTNVGLSGPPLWIAGILSFLFLAIMTVPFYLAFVWMRNPAKARIGAVICLVAGIVSLLLFGFLSFGLLAPLELVGVAGGIVGLVQTKEQGNAKGKT